MLRQRTTGTWAATRRSRPPCHGMPRHAKRSETIISHCGQRAYSRHTSPPTYRPPRPPRPETLLLQCPSGGAWQCLAMPSGAAGPSWPPARVGVSPADPALAPYGRMQLTRKAMRCRGSGRVGSGRAGLRGQRLLRTATASNLIPSSPFREWRCLPPPGLAPHFGQPFRKPARVSFVAAGVDTGRQRTRLEHCRGDPTAASGASVREADGARASAASDSTLCRSKCYELIGDAAISILKGTGSSPAAARRSSFLRGTRRHCRPTWPCCRFPRLLPLRPL